MYLIWDFDGVLIDSNDIREMGFRKVLQGYNPLQIDDFINYHRQNGGLSRYHKFNYFFESIVCEDKASSVINDLCENYKMLMLEALGKDEYLIQETVGFMKRLRYLHEQMLVSASDESELKILTKSLNVDHFFTQILGSPTSKLDNLRMLIEKDLIDPDDAIYIGDSLNDKEAAEINGICFIGYNNLQLKELPNINYAHNVDEIMSFIG